MELQTQNLSIPNFKNSMAFPLTCNSITDWHVFSGADLESESRIPSSNFSNSITKLKIKAALELFDFISFPSLVQFWSPTISHDHQEFLDSADLPFALRGMREGICSFRKRCSNYRYSVRGDRCGPPARVFRRRFPEFCPDIRCYFEEEFELKELAMAAGIRGYLCLPVFEPDWQFCVGVLDIFTTMDGSFCLDNLIDKVSASLKEVGLRCSDVFWPFDTKNPTYDQPENGPEQYKCAVNEIQNVLDVLCRTYKLPFAQTWVATSSGTNEESFISTVKLEPVKKSSFQRDCNWFHLRKGQGIVWKAFSSGTCFCRDLTKLSIDNYGLVLSARKVDFTGGFAICLRSTHTRNLVYIIELLLPPNQSIYQQPWVFLTPLLDTMKHQFKTFKLRTGQDIGSDLPVEVLKTSEDDPLDSFVIRKTMHAGKGLKNQAYKPQQTPAVPLIFDTGAHCRGPETVKIREKTAGSSSVSKCFHNGKMVSSHDNITKDRNEPHSQGIMQSKIRPTRTLCLAEVVSTKAPQELSENKLKKSQDNPNAKRSMSNNMNGRPPGKRSRVDHSAAKHIAETIQQTASCSVSPPDEGRCSLSSLSPVVAPVQNQGCIMTVKADFEGDIIKFTVPAVCGIMKLKDEVMKRLRLNAVDFEFKYHREDNIWVLLDTDAKLLEYARVVRSSGTNTIKVSISPRTETANDAIKMIVKASYKDDMIKFEFPPSAGILELKNEMTQMLQLESGSFEIKCTDANNCPVFLDSDTALRNYINTVTAQQKNTMRLCIQPIKTQSSISNECIVIMKATYGDDIIKFKHSLSSGLMNLKDEVTQRLKLEAGNFVVKYLDEDGNGVLVDEDAALTNYITTMTSLGKDTVRISLHDIDQQA